MTKSKRSLPEHINIPPRQQPIRTAHQQAVEALRGQNESQLIWLGAVRAKTRWRLPVMNDRFLVDLEAGEVCRESGDAVRPTWSVLALHYLAVRTRVSPGQPKITFASLPSARTYATVYQARVNRRLCAGVGSNTDSLLAAAAAVGGEELSDGDLAFEFRLFPHIPIRLIWYAADDEFPSSCTLLLPANIESFFSIEDVVVLSESFVSRLSGTSF